MNIRIANLFILFFLFFFISFGFAQDKAKPKNGEGLHAFLLRNKRPPSEYADRFFELNKHKLGKNNTLLWGVEYVLPSLNETKLSHSGKKSIGSKLREPLFGKKYEEYSMDSHDLAGACFFLCSGHGGKDPGALTSVNGRTLSEDEYNYDIMLRLARNLLQEGATVHIIIQDKKNGIRDDRFLLSDQTETCMGEKLPKNKKERLKQRSKKVNQLSKNAKEKYQRALFIHLDSRGQEQVDIYSFYQDDTEESKRFSENIQAIFRRQYEIHQPGRGFSGKVKSNEHYYYVLRESKPVAVLIECGNLHNSQDRMRFLESSNRQAVANWLLKAIKKDYEDWKKKK